MRCKEDSSKDVKVGHFKWSVSKLFENKSQKQSATKKHLEKIDSYENKENEYSQTFAK